MTHVMQFITNLLGNQNSIRFNPLMFHKHIKIMFIKKTINHCPLSTNEGTSLRWTYQNQEPTVQVTQLFWLIQVLNFTSILKSGNSLIHFH